jgi:uncharacterized protein (TIGR03435 family)
MKLFLTLGLGLFSLAAGAGGDGGPQVGDAAPLSSATALLQAPAGAKLDAASLRGQVVMLEFWATWCGPCVAAIPHLNELADKFKDQPARFIAITAEDEATIKPFLAKRPIHAWIALDTDKAMNKAYAVGSIPRTVLLDKEGKIAGITHPAQLTERHLADLLAGKKISLAGGQGEAVANRQINEKPALFEISVRPSSATNERGFGWGNGNLNARGCTAGRMLAMAFRTTAPRIITNAPIPDGMYDFTITQPRCLVEAEDNTPELVQQALQLAFGLTGRKETRETKVFLLRVKATAAVGRTVSPTQGRSFRYGGGEISGVGVSMELLSSVLEQLLKRPIIDETQLKEDYDIALKWNEEGPEALGREALIQAVREQLGLELVPAVRPVEMVVIEQNKEVTAKAAVKKR